MVPPHRPEPSPPGPCKAPMWSPMAVCPELRGAGPSFSLSNLPPGPGAVPPWGSEFARRKEAETEDKGEERDLGEEVGGLWLPPEAGLSCGRRSTCLQPARRWGRGDSLSHSGDGSRVQPPPQPQPTPGSLVPSSGRSRAPLHSPSALHGAEVLRDVGQRPAGGPQGHDALAA